MTAPTVLVTARSFGTGRRDLAADLSADGLSLEGIRRILDLQAEVASLRRMLTDLRRDQASTALVVWRPSRSAD